MAVVWPSKNNFANGDVLTAANMNNIADTLNVFNPTSATNGQVPIANGSGSVAFGTLSVAAYTVISSGTLSTSTGTLTLTSIPGTYKDLVFYLRNWRPATSGATAIMRCNNDSGSNYHPNGIYGNGAISGGNNTSGSITQLSMTNTLENHNVLWFYDYAQVTPTNILSMGAGRTNTNATTSSIYNLAYVNDAAITRFDIILSTGNFGAGDYVLYGVN